MAVLSLVAVQASSAAAQGTANPNGGNIALSASFDITNAYLFRGLRQDDTGLIMWPAADVGVRLFEAAGPVLHVGTWNSLNTGLAGSDGPTQRLWYESDFYTTLSFALTNDFAASATYTAYTSPNGSFSNVKELSFKVGPTDTAALSPTFLSPYALIAFELDTHPGLGQADGGQEAGTYLEFGAAPRWISAPVDVFFPIRVGLSLSNYYELAGEDHAFGFLSLGAHAQVPFGRAGNYGAWNVHGGVDFYSLGDTPEAFNAGDQTKLVASVGIGFTY
jgi:5-hydroxyisourate hydrolase-like protein (transthyretin family)